MDNVRQSEVSQPSQPELEVCIPQLTPDILYYKGMAGTAMDLAVRSEQSTAITIPELRSILKQANPALANSTITTMDKIVEDSLGSQRLAAHLLEIFGGAALLLCVAGLYGLLAYVVTQRKRELGVRIALGAKRRDVVSLVMRQAGIMLLAGLVLGTVAIPLLPEHVSAIVLGPRSSQSEGDLKALLGGTLYCRTSVPRSRLSM